MSRAHKHTHVAGDRLIPEFGVYREIGRCVVCRRWFSLGYADESLVDVAAASIIAKSACGEPCLATHAEESGLASTHGFYGGPGWDAGWLASAWAQHDALQRDVEPDVTESACSASLDDVPPPAADEPDGEL